MVVINGCMFLRIGGDYCFAPTPTSNNIERFGEVILASSSSPVDLVSARGKSLQHLAYEIFHISKGFLT